MMRSKLSTPPKVSLLLSFTVITLMYLSQSVQSAGAINQDPPFAGTVFIDPNIIIESDPSAYVSMTYEGRDTRVMFDRRVNNWINVEPYLFDAVFDDGLSIEIQVNPEFGSVESARAEAEKFAPPIGQLATSLRRDVETVWIHMGTELFGGGNKNILIHTGQAANYINDGILEEVLVHEAVHTSLDADHARSQGWLDAQISDNQFISTYARDYPDREDLAESFLPYLAIRYFPDRISEELKNTIENTIPNRIAYLDAQNFDVYPITTSTDIGRTGLNDDHPDKITLRQNYPNPFNPVTIIHYELPVASDITLNVVDMTGRTVAVLHKGMQSSGAHEHRFDGSNLASGVYIYRLSSGNFEVSRRMLLIK